MRISIRGTRRLVNNLADQPTMCTLIVLHRCVAGRPLVVAANRDEFFDRPAEDMALRASRTGPILSPLDLEAGGTWLGLNQRGVFAGLTNLRPGPAVTGGSDDSSSQPVADPMGPDLKSRGDVVMAALEAESAANAVETLLKLEEATYNPFQLLVADGQDAWLIVYRDRPRAIELEPGPHIVGNVEDERIAAMLGTPDALQDAVSEQGAGGSKGAYSQFGGVVRGVENPIDSKEPRALKLMRVRERVEKMVMEPGLDLFEGLARICREHIDQKHIDQKHIDHKRIDHKHIDQEKEQSKNPEKADKGIQSPLEATCVHVADRYGTRSSLLLELSENSEASRMWTTDGPPCERPFDNRSSLLVDLGVRLNSRDGTETMLGETVEKNW